MPKDKERRILEYLAYIAVKYHVDSDTLFDLFVEAWKKKKSIFKDLGVLCREKSGESAAFLFTVNRKVASQFPLLTTTLEHSDYTKGYLRYILNDVKMLRGSVKGYRGRPTRTGGGHYSTLVSKT